MHWWTTWPLAAVLILPQALTSTENQDYQDLLGTGVTQERPTPVPAPQESQDRKGSRELQVRPHVPRPHHHLRGQRPGGRAERQLAERGCCREQDWLSSGELLLQRPWPGPLALSPGWLRSQVGACAPLLW